MNAVVDHPPAVARLALGAACGAGFLWGTGALVVNVLIARHGFTPENIAAKARKLVGK